jgi:hypothetical protein
MLLTSYFNIFLIDRAEPALEVIGKVLYSYIALRVVQAITPDRKVSLQVAIQHQHA